MKIAATLLLMLYILTACASGTAEPAYSGVYIPPAQAAIDFPFPLRTFAAGNTASFAIANDNTLWAWGSNATGELGNGVTRHWAQPFPMPLPILADTAWVTSGGSGHRSGSRGHTLAIRTDGTLWGWGDNFHGQLGDGTAINRLYPTFLMENVVFVATGSTHALAIRADGSLWGWGVSAMGQLGAEASRPVARYPVQIIESGVIYAAVGPWRSYAIKEGNTLWGWGVSDIFSPDNDNPTPALLLSDVIKIEAATLHTLVLKTDNSLWVWGDNSHGQLGDGTQETRAEPFRLMEDITDIAAAAYFSAALRSDGRLYAWGCNANGQVSLSNDEMYTSPVFVTHSVAAVAAGGPGWDTYTQEGHRLRGGFGHLLALQKDGTLLAWGCNWHGQIGNGTFSYEPQGVQAVKDGVKLP